MCGGNLPKHICKTPEKGYLKVLVLDLRSSQKMIQTLSFVSFKIFSSLAICIARKFSLFTFNFKNTINNIGYP